MKSEMEGEGEKEEDQHLKEYVLNEQERMGGGGNDWWEEIKRKIGREECMERKVAH